MRSKKLNQKQKENKDLKNKSEQNIELSVDKILELISTYHLDMDKKLEEIHNICNRE